MLYWLDLFGIFVFALSGALAADRRGMDLFGFVAIALLPAIGGGTVRDLALSGSASIAVALGVVTAVSPDPRFSNE